jgi:hypothetical protein
MRNDSARSRAEWQPDGCESCRKEFTIEMPLFIESLRRESDLATLRHLQRKVGPLMHSGTDGLAKIGGINGARPAYFGEIPREAWS